MKLVFSYVELKEVLDVVVGLSWLDCFTFTLEGTGPNSFTVRLGPVRIKLVDGNAEATCRELKEKITDTKDLSNRLIELRKACGLSTLCTTSGGRVKATVVEGTEEVPVRLFNTIKPGLEIVYKKRVELFVGSVVETDAVYLMKAVRTKSDVLLQLYNPKRRSFWYVGLKELKSEYPDLFRE